MEQHDGRAPFRFPGQREELGDGVVRAPTRIVWGVPGGFMETRLARLSLRYCAEGSYLEVPGSGHWILHEEPDLTTRILAEFFRSER